MVASISHDERVERLPGLRSGDLWGGLAAAAVLLPQAMAFGVALYAIAGLDAAAGAYAGLAGTAIICIMSGLLGGARGLISAPTGPTLVLLGGALASMLAQGLDRAQLLLGLALTIAIAGVLQFLIGLSGGGKLIKYIPFPVVSGFMTGSAILMILSQRAPLIGGVTDAQWSTWIVIKSGGRRWVGVATGLVFVLLVGVGGDIGRILPSPTRPVNGQTPRSERYQTT